MSKFMKILLAIVLLLAVAAGAVVAATQLGGHTHNLTKVDKIEATCTEAGQEAYYVCDGCDDIFADVNGTTVLDAPKAIAALGHKIVGVAGSEPTCTEAGVADCYKCSKCEILFSDAKGENEIEAPETTAPLGHDLVKTEANEVSCTEDGNNAYWTCNTCKKVYKDAEGKTETTVADETIISEGHKLNKTDAIAAGCTTAGNIDYWTCENCEKIYKDADGKGEINAADTVIGALGHSYSATLIVEGAVTTYEPGASFDTSNLVVKLDCINCDHYETVENYNVSKIDNLQPEDTEIVITYENYSATVSITVVHVHTTGELVSAVDPTCTETGTLAYYECTVCKTKFEDKAATKALADVTVSAKGHNGVKTDAVDPSCTVEGNNAYWTCNECDKVFSDEACTIETTVDAEKLPVTAHDTEAKSDSEGHWEDCINCDYTTEKASHSGIAYPDAAPKCDVCGTEFGEASWEDWVLYRPSTKVPPSVTASRETVEGIWATRYIISAGATDIALEHESRDAYYAGKYQVRVPVVSGVPTYVYLRVINNSEDPVSFTFQDHGRPDDGVAISLEGKASGWYKFNVTGNNTIGDWYQILMAEGNNGADITIYGYFYTGNLEVDNLQVANQNDLKLSYEVGEKFDISNIILSAYILNSNGSALADISAETYHIVSNYTISGLTNGQVLEEGTYTVTVSFGGQSVDLTVSVSSHDHLPEFVEKKPATCTEDGHEAYYICNVNGCGQLFADAEGNTPLTEITVLPAGHLTGTALPGGKAACPRCDEETGEVRDANGWVHFIPATYTSIASEIGSVNGQMAAIYTVPAGTAAGAKYNFETHNTDSAAKDGKYQVRIPLQGERKIIVYFQNMSNVDATVKFGDDTFNLGNTTVTVLANSYATAEFVLNGNTIGPWMGMQLISSVPAGEDLKLAIYGYMYVEENEANLSNLSILQSANTLTFKPGSTFNAEGLILGASHIYNLNIRSGYTTDFDGYTFTAADSGKKTVTVTFAGLTATYEIEVLDHVHEAVEVPGKAKVQCVENGYETYYTCSVEGCNKMFSDADCTNEISAPIVIPAHEAITALPGEEIVCSVCGNTYGEIRDGQNWVLYNVTTNYINHGVVNGKITTSSISGILSSIIHIGAGTAGGTGNNFQLCMNDNDSGRQTVIPNLGDGAQDGDLRNVIVFYKNYGEEDVVLNLQNDANGGNGKITVPAGGTAISEFAISNVGGSNWFNLYIDSNVTTDIDIEVYGYIYVNEGEVEQISTNTDNCNLTFKVGDTFSAEGLVINAPIPSSNTKTVYVTTGYTTNLDGKVFDEAGTYTVEVTFAGVTTTYDITVEE